MQNTPPNRPFPAGLIALLALPLVGAGAWLAWQWYALELSAPWLVTALRVALFTVPPIYVAVFVWQRWGRQRYIDAYHVERLTLAQRSQGLPTSITSLNYHDSHRIDQAAPPLALPGPEAASSPPSVPTFAALLDGGLIGPGRQLILGYNAETSQAVSGSWRDLYSCGVGALQGAGKSWLIAFLLSQSAAAGARLIICDPHAGSDESLSIRIAALAGAFMCDVASSDDEILTALRLANDKLERRKAGSGGDWPIVVAVDEWSSLLRGRLGAELPGLVQNISEQGRKFNVNAILSAQGWTVAAASIVRNRLTAHYVLRQRDQEARYQLGLRAAQMPVDIPSLPDATGYLLPTRGQLTKIVIPRMDAASIARAGALIDRPAAAGVSFGFTLPTAPLTPIVASGKADGSQTEGNTELPSTAAQPAKAAPPEAARAYALFMAGKSPQEIASELRGVNSTAGGRAYQKALSDVYDLIRQGGQK